MVCLDRGGIGLDRTDSSGGPSGGQIALRIRWVWSLFGCQYHALTPSYLFVASTA
jgi:hypothetical protein